MFRPSSRCFRDDRGVGEGDVGDKRLLCQSLRLPFKRREQHRMGSVGALGFKGPAPIMPFMLDFTLESLLNLLQQGSAGLIHGKAAVAL